MAAPLTLAGMARMEIRLGGETVGDLDYRTCPACQLGIIDSLRVTTAVRRRGLATHAVTTLLATYPTYTWTTSTIATTVEAATFWSALGWPTTRGHPGYCDHMCRADEHIP